MTKLKVIKGIGEVIEPNPCETPFFSHTEYLQWKDLHPSGLLCVYSNGETARDGESEGELVWQYKAKDLINWKFCTNYNPEIANVFSDSLETRRVWLIPAEAEKGEEKVDKVKLELEIDELATEHAELYMDGSDHGFSLSLYKQAFSDGYHANSGAAHAQQQNGWVRVDDRLPEDTNTVWTYFKGQNGKLIPCVAQYTKGKELDCDYDSDDSDHLDYDEAKDTYYLPAGWYENSEQSGGSYDFIYHKRDVVLWKPVSLTK